MISAADISWQRLASQQIQPAYAKQPFDVVSRMGMIQAQDYLGALWAVGLRMQEASEADVERALAERSIVRTWPARGTLHFAAAADVRWMLDLLSARTIAGRAGRFSELGLDEETFSQSRNVIVTHLEGGCRLTREEIFPLLEAAGISTAGQRGIHILWRLAQAGLICFGPRRGKQQTFVLLDEWIPPAPKYEREQALAELARRYFSGHGPATLKDYTWWSGLTISEAKAGLEMIKQELVEEVYDGQHTWRADNPVPPSEDTQVVHLLPGFDEYLVGYQDRSAVLDGQYARRANNGGGILNPVILSGGRVVGTWKRTIKKSGVEVIPDWFSVPTPAQAGVFEAAAQRYGAFLGLPVS